MIAKILHDNGLNMGPIQPESDYTKYEDLNIHQARMQQDDTALELAIERRNKDIFWGFKHPGAFEWVSKYPFKNPHFIVVTRDLTAVLQRWKYHEHGDVNDLKIEHDRMFAFISSCRDPLLLVSYERSKEDPLQATQQILRFVDGKP